MRAERALCYIGSSRDGNPLLCVTEGASLLSEGFAALAAMKIAAHFLAAECAICHFLTASVPPSAVAAVMIRDTSAAVTTVQFLGFRRA